MTALSWNNCKAQRQTLFQIGVNLKTDFQLGQLYVVMSRVGNVERLWILTKKVKEGKRIYLKQDYNICDILKKEVHVIVL